MDMLGFNARSQTSLSAMSDELVQSSDIEGLMLNPQSVRSSIARRLGIDDEGLAATDHYVEGLVDVMLSAIRNCNQPLIAECLFGWHAALFPNGRSGMHRITVAGWRQGVEPMQVVSGAMGHERVHYQAPPSAQVPSEMESFLNWCNAASLSPFLMAAVAHFWFVSVHPFDDGNGRISRTIADMFLARLDSSGMRYYSVSAEINRNKKDYYEILELTQRGGMDITGWLLWFFGCVERAIARALATVDRTVKKAAFWDRFSDVAVNERQRKVLNRLWDGFDGNLTSSKWAKMCHCSQDTALRDINQLLDTGMLCRAPSSGRSTHYLLPE